MARLTVVLVVAIVILVPVLFAALGGSRDAGLIVGIVLVAVGLVASLAGSRRSGDEG